MQKSLEVEDFWILNELLKKLLKYFFFNLIFIHDFIDLFKLIVCKESSQCEFKNIWAKESRKFCETEARHKFHFTHLLPHMLSNFYMSHHIKLQQFSLWICIALRKNFKEEECDEIFGVFIRVIKEKSKEFLAVHSHTFEIWKKFHHRKKYLLSVVCYHLWMSLSYLLNFMRVKYNF